MNMIRFLIYIKTYKNRVLSGDDMKILKHGCVNNSTHRFECRKCGCVFQLNHNEFQRNTYYTDYTCIRREFIYYCPDCHGIIRFNL